MTIKELVARMPLKVKKIDGKYLAYFPALREIKAEGNTQEEALNNARAMALKTLQSEIQEEKVVASVSDIAVTAGGPDAAFWNGKTIEELKIEQGVKPFDFSKAGKNWPADADFNKFTAAINSGRKYPREW